MIGNAIFNGIAYLNKSFKLIFPPTNDNPVSTIRNKKRVYEKVVDKKTNEKGVLNHIVATNAPSRFIAKLKIAIFAIFFSLCFAIKMALNPKELEYKAKVSAIIEKQTSVP